MRGVTARPLAPRDAFPRGSVMLGLAYRAGELTIRLQGRTANERLRVVFTDVIGVRVLDERDMLEYWPTCSTPNGWLFEITGGGWLSQEATRAGSLITAMTPDAKEYLVAGEEACVSVICRTGPMVEEDTPCPGDTARHYLGDLGGLLRDNWQDAEARFRTASGADKAFEDGRRRAYRQVLTLMLQQAESFELDPASAGLQGLDVDRDLGY